MNKLQIYKPVENEDDLGEWFLIELRKIVKNCDIAFDYNPRAIKLYFSFKPVNTNLTIVVTLEPQDYRKYLYPERLPYSSDEYDVEKHARYTVINIVREFEHELNCKYVKNYYGYAENGYLPQ